MSNGRTENLTLVFDVEKEDDERWPWVATVRSIEPKRTGLKGGPCSRCDGYVEGGRICDACATEDSIGCCGAEEWLKQAGVGLDREGVLTVVAYVEWWHWSGVDGDDWDDETHLISATWEARR